MHFGIDYGSKLAGTTVVTWNKGLNLMQRSSLKKEDADEMIMRLVIDLQPTAVYIDAPLSLPNAFYGKGEDYFYRKADRELSAMSPMFLGGLTARACKLRALIEKEKIKIFETYPGAFVRQDKILKSLYDKKDLSSVNPCLMVLKDQIGAYRLPHSVTTLHALDSLIAWNSGRRHIQGNAAIIGDPKEGAILF